MKLSSFRNSFRYYCNVNSNIIRYLDHFNCHLNGNQHLQFLNIALPELLENVPDNIKHSMRYKNDDAHCHYAWNFRNKVTFTITDKPAKYN